MLDALYFVAWPKMIMISVTLPEGLRRQFADVQRRLWRVETTVALCSIIGGLVHFPARPFLFPTASGTRRRALRVVFSLAGLAFRRRRVLSLGDGAGFGIAAA